MSNPLDPKLDLSVNTDPEEARSFKELVSAVRAGQWDAFMFTDGSGSTITRPGGYGAVILDRRKSGMTTITGSVSNCTSQQAEVRAVYEAMYYFIRNKKGVRSGGYRVHLVTDSEYVAKTLKKIAADPVEVFSSKKHAMLWLGIQYAMRRGILVRPTHIHRNRNPLMVLADKLSKEARFANSSVPCEQLTEEALSACKREFPL